jgi:hypothetical protein
MSIHERIANEVLSWDGVTSASHRFGGIEFLLGKRELGHLHGDRLADLPFPSRVRDELVEAGGAKPHHVLPESGWVSLDRGRGGCPPRRRPLQDELRPGAGGPDPSAAPTR